MLEPIIVKLKEIQAREKVSGVAFAQKLGVHPSLWSRASRGKSQPGRDLLDGAFRAYPELAYVHVQGLHSSQDSEASVQDRREEIAV